LSPWRQVFNQAKLPGKPGEPIVYVPGSDTSTWNGALLAAMSYKYAATKDPQTLSRISELLLGLHFFFEVTGMPGLMARSVTRADAFAHDAMKANVYRAADGTNYIYSNDPARGTFNQIAEGYAVMMMLAYADLPPQIQQMARNDIRLMVLHVIDHNYKATERDGRPTTYGDMTPLAGPISVPFNGQVAYLIVALGYCYPPDDPNERARIIEQFDRLRVRHHSYYEDPLRHVIVPQRVGSSPFVKGMNDRNHVTNAAYVGLMLDFNHARRNGRHWDPEFVYQLGQTIYHSFRYLHDQRNSLCSFMCVAILNDTEVFNTIVTEHRNRVTAEIERALIEAVQQLQHFSLARFSAPGRDTESKDLHWCDEFRVDDYYWKVGPNWTFQPTAPPSDTAWCAIDYLHAYWLMRYYRLDQHPAVTKFNLPELRRTR
jgi:hypothetical protein